MFDRVSIFYEWCVFNKLYKYRTNIKCGRSCHCSGLRATLGARDFCALSGYDQTEDVSACGDTGVSIFTRGKYSGFRVVAGSPLVTNAPPWKRRCAPLELTTNDS